MKKTPEPFTYQTYYRPENSRRAGRVPHHQPNEEPKKPRRLAKLRRFIRIALLLVVVLIVGWLIYVFSFLYSSAHKLNPHKGFFATAGSMVPSSIPKNDSRINILLAGNSADDPGHSGANLTDSIMIVSIDPSTKSEVMISVPRDLYADIPGYGHAKINTAYQDGQSSSFSEAGYPSGGMGLLEKTVSQDFGIQFSGYALIDYTAFRDAVNAVGGVTVNISSQDPRGLYDPYTNLKLPNGSVDLDGQEALNLARARGDGPGSYGFPRSDFDRTAHQQQMLAALKGKVNGINFLLRPNDIPNLVSAATNNVQTNLTLGQLETLYLDSKKVGQSGTKTITLNDYNGHDLLASYYSYGSGDSLIPAAGMDDFSQIQAAVNAALNQ